MQVTLYAVSKCGDFYNSQFRQVASLCKDLIRQVSL